LCAGFESGDSVSRASRPARHDQITDSVSQINTSVVAEAPAMALANLYQSLAHATGIAFQNAVAAQQQQNIAAQAATNLGVMQLYGLDTAATQKILA
jgi:hypothetical protein